jgi:hypothetical protein
MSSSSSPNLVLELNHSWLRHLPALLLLTTALSLPWLADALSPVACVLCGAVAASAAAFSLWQTGFARSAAQLVRVSWDQEQRWQLQFRAGKPITASLSGRSWYSPWLLCLKFNTETGKAHQLMLWRGELTPIAWHQWQLRLRLEGGRELAIPDVGVAS